MARKFSVELATYQAHKQRLLAEHPGKFAVIHGDRIAGVWNDYETAVRSGYERFAPADFLVKRIEEKETVHIIPAGI